MFILLQNQTPSFSYERGRDVKPLLSPSSTGISPLETIFRYGGLFKYVSPDCIFRTLAPLTESTISAGGFIFIDSHAPLRSPAEHIIRGNPKETSRLLPSRRGRRNFTFSPTCPRPYSGVRMAAPSMSAVLYLDTVSQSYRK